MRNILEGRWVIDSHLLVYILDRSSPFYSRSQLLFNSMMSGKIQPVVTIQNIIEAENTLIKVYKISPAVVVEKIENMLSICDFTIIAPFITTYLSFHYLLTKTKLILDFYDNFLAATMLDNRINRILTVNTKDFYQIKEIEAVNPFE